MILIASITVAVFSVISALSLLHRGKQQEQAEKGLKEELLQKQKRIAELEKQITGKEEQATVPKKSTVLMIGDLVQVTTDAGITQFAWVVGFDKDWLPVVIDYTAGWHPTVPADVVKEIKSACVEWGVYSMKPCHIKVLVPAGVEANYREVLREARAALEKEAA